PGKSTVFLPKPNGNMLHAEEHRDLISLKVLLRILSGTDCGTNFLDPTQPASTPTLFIRKTARTALNLRYSCSPIRSDLKICWAMLQNFASIFTIRRYMQNIRREL